MQVLSSLKVKNWVLVQVAYKIVVDVMASPKYTVAVADDNCQLPPVKSLSIEPAVSFLHEFMSMLINARPNRNNSDLLFFISVPAKITIAKQVI